MVTHATAMSVGSLLNTSSPARVVVPRLQRPYSWDSSELSELWTDLYQFNDRHPGTNLAGKEYFLGSIVATHMEGADEKYEILDGQQRLATLTIILAVIRNLLQENDCDEDAFSIQLTHISKKQGVGNPPKFALTLNKVDEKFFRDVVQKTPSSEKDPLTPSQKLISKAKKYFTAALTKYAEESSATPIEVYTRIQTIILNNLRIVLIASSNIDNVTDAFERLNDRGKGLSTLDLLRTLLIGRAGSPENSNEVDAAWASIYELSTSPATVESFLRHTWVTRRGDVKSRSLYKEIKGEVTAKSAPKNLSDPVEFSNELANDSVIYKAIVNNEHQDLECTRWLRAINTMGASALLPCALSAVIALPEAEAQALVLRALVTTFVRFNVIGEKESTLLEKGAYIAARDLRENADPEVALKALRPLLVPDPEFRASFRSALVARAGYQRHLLEELEYFLSSKSPHTSGSPEKIVGGSGVLWIEHVYPQKPEKTWGRWVGHDEIINRLGNLTLIHKKLNSSMKNRTFDLKKPDYRESELALNGYFDKKLTWNESDIDRRQADLAKYAPSIWPLF